MSKLINIRKKPLNDENLLIFEFILCFFTVLSTVLNNSTIASITFNLSFILLLVYFIKSIYNYKFNKNEGINLYVFILIIVLGFICVFFTSQTSQISFEYYKKCIMFSCTIIMIFLSSIIKIKKSTIGCILIINIITSLIYVIAYFILGMSGTRYLTFNFTNPNLTAMWLLQSALYMPLCIDFFNGKIIKITCVILTFVLSYFIYLTESRTCLIAFCIFVFIYVFMKFKNKLKINKIILFVLITTPLIFAITYMFSINTNLVNTFDFLASEGKGLDSRVHIWEFVFDIIKAYPLTGNYYKLSGGTGGSQSHNSHLDIIASYGIIVFILVIFLIFRIIKNINKNSSSKFQLTALIAFLTVIVMGIGEAALFSGGQGIYILSCGFLFIANSQADI